MPSHIPFVDGDQAASNRVTASWLNGVNDFIFTSLPAGTGPSLIGWIRAATGAVTTTLAKWMGFQPQSVFEFMTIAQIADVQAGTRTLDVSAACQAFINACAGKKGRFEPGTYKIGTALNFLNHLDMDFCAGQAAFALATQNMNGFVIGDGTLGTRALLYGTVLRNPAFIANPGVTAFTSGACIYENNVAFITVLSPSFYGLDGATKKLYQGLKQSKCVECDTPYILSQSMKGQTWYADGTGTGANATIDCNCDFLRSISGDTDAVYWGNYTSGMAMYRPTVYSHTNGWALQIDSLGGSYGTNYFVTDADFEIDPPAGKGVYFKTGRALWLRGGWMAASSTGGVIPVGIQMDSGASNLVINMQIDQARVVLSGPVWQIGAETTISGDLVTAGVGLQIDATAIDGSIASGAAVRQWPGTGISYTGAPARVNIGSVRFRNNGTDITAITGFALDTAPVIGKCQSDKTRAITAAATLPVPVSLSYVQVTGATNITTIPLAGQGSQLMIQASGSITIASGGNIFAKGMPVTVTTGNVIVLECDGVNSWFEVGRNF